MKSMFTLLILLTAIMLINELHAQDYKMEWAPKIEATYDIYDTFSAIEDEAGFKADVYRSYETATKMVQASGYLVETWMVTDAWKRLSFAEQKQFLGALPITLEAIMVNGKDLVSLYSLDPHEGEQLAHADYFTIWRIPFVDDVAVFEQLAAETGWKQYFRRVGE